MSRAVLVFVTICLFQIVRGADWKRHPTYDKIYNKTNKNPYRNVGSVFNLHDMIECATRCDPWALNNYGNFCGLGGSGVPIDDIDSCCEQHDVCYDDNMSLYDCSKGEVYAWGYTWSCNNGYPSCGDGFDRCSLWTCVCDTAFVDCVRDAGCPRQ